MDWRRRPGHPRHSRLGTLEVDLHSLNHKLGDFPRLENDGGRLCKRLRSSPVHDDQNSGHSGQSSVGECDIIVVDLANLPGYQ